MTPVYRSLHMRGKEGAVVGSSADANVTNMVARELYDQIIDIQTEITYQTLIVCRIDIQ